MFMRLIRLSLILVFLAVALAAPSATAVAVATSTAQAASGVHSFSSGTFIAYATATTAGANPNGVALTLSNSKGLQTFYVRNTGTLATRAISLSVSYSSPPGTTALLRCDVDVLFASANNDNCVSGSSTSVTASASLTLALNPGSWYAFRLNPQNRTAPTISVSVSSAQIQLPLIRNN